MREFKKRKGMGRGRLLILWVLACVMGNITGLTGISSLEAQKNTQSAKRGASKKKAKLPEKPRKPPAPRYIDTRGLDQLRSEISRQAGSVGGQFGIIAVSLSKGDTLFAWNPDLGLMPASTMKVLTTVLAFDILGPEYQFYTEVWADRAPEQNGDCNCNIYLKGSGDPSLSGRWWRGGGILPMEFLAQEVAKTGIKRIAGSVVGDESAFERKLIPDGWKTDYLSTAYAARVSALSLNENLTGISISPQTGPVLVPEALGSMVVNQVNLVRGRSIHIGARSEVDGIVRVTGNIGVNAGTKRFSIVVPDPALYTTGVLASRLMAHGVGIGGGVKLGVTPRQGVKIAAVRSPPLKEIVNAMNKHSINHLAELLLRAAARGTDESKIGSAALGQAQLRQLMFRIGGDSSRLRVADGSGLSRLDQITVRGMVQILSYANKAKWKGDFHNSLPIAGFEALMRNRMRSSQAQGNLHAKTGTTDDVAALAGYVTTANGELVAFSFIYNGPKPVRIRAKNVMDQMGMTLAAWAR